VIWARQSGVLKTIGANVDIKIHNLLKETVPLLREASSELRAKLETSAALKIEETATALEELVKKGSADRLSIIEIVHSLGEGLALVSSIAELLKVLK
jgi:hypothetical protein